MLRLFSTSPTATRFLIEEFTPTNLTQPEKVRALNITPQTIPPLFEIKSSWLVDHALPACVILFFLLKMIRELYIARALSTYGVHAEANVDAVSRGKPGWLRIQYHFNVSGATDQVIAGKDSALKSYMDNITPGKLIGIRYYQQNPKISRIDHNGFQNWGLRVWRGRKA